MGSSESTKRARAVVSEMFGSDTLARMEAGRGDEHFAGNWSEAGLSYVFGDVWARGGIERKTRSLITMAMLIALRAERELRIHIGGALRNGVSIVEIEELVAQASGYCGFPAAGMAINAAREILQENGLLDKDGRILHQTLTLASFGSEATR